MPLLIIVGDEDDWCLDASVFLRRTVPTAGLLVVPRTGHTLTSEEPEKFNAALAELFAEAESGPLARAQATHVNTVISQGERRWTSSSKARPRW